MTVDELSFRSRGVYLADHAVVESGKLYVHGALVTRLNLVSFPIAHVMSVVAAVEVPWHAYQQDHTLTIGLLDDDGEPLPLNIEGTFRVGADPSMRRGDPTILPFAVTIPLPLQRPGDYVLVLSVDGSELDRWSFRAQLGIAVPTAPPPPPPSARGDTD
jgi:hypothetical protein